MAGTLDDFAYTEEPSQGDWFAQNAPTTGRSFGNPTLDAIADAYRRAGHEPTPTEVMQWGTKVDANYYKKIESQIYRTYANQPKTNTATTPTGSREDQVRAIFAKYGGVITPETLAQARGELNAIGAKVQNEDRGDFRPRLYFDDGAFTVDLGDFGGPMKWVERGDTRNQGGGGTLLQPFSESFSYQPFEKPPDFKAPTAEDAFNDQGFQGVLKRGQDALEKSAAARGTLLTTGTLQELGDYTQDTAAQQYDKVYNRKLGEYTLNYGHAETNYNRDRGNALEEFGLRHDLYNEGQDRPFNKLVTLAGFGRGLDDGSNYANAGSGLYTGQGNANAASSLYGGNAWQNAGSNLANLGGYYYQQYQNGRKGRA